MTLHHADVSELARAHSGNGVGAADDDKVGRLAAPEPGRQLRAVLGSRKQIAAVRIIGRGQDGAIVAEVQAAQETDKPLRLKALVEDILGQGACRLNEAEWSELLASQTPNPDRRWVLLLRLAVEANAEQGKLRDQFVALPDGTVFSMRLLLERPGGAEKGTTAFSRLPDFVRIAALGLALDEEARQRESHTDKKLAHLLGDALDRLGLPVGEVKGQDVSRLREKLVRNGAGNLFPKRQGRRQRHQSRTSRLSPPKG